MNQYGLIAFALPWFGVMGSFLYYTLRVAPRALDRWADERGYRILRRRQANFIEAFPSFMRGNGYLVFRVTLRDEAGDLLDCLVRVGRPYWPCLSADRCPVVDIRWEAVKHPLPSKSKAWDRDLD